MSISTRGKCVAVLLLGLLAGVCLLLQFKKHSSQPTPCLPERFETDGPKPESLLLKLKFIYLSIYLLRKANIGLSNQKCPFRKAKLNDLPPLPRVKSDARRVYLQAPWGAPIIWENTKANAQARLTEGPFNIGLSITVIGSYAKYLQPMVTGLDKYFMVDQNVTYFLFTDDLRLPKKIQSKRRMVALEEKNRGWPCNTLLRFGAISKHQHRFAAVHFLYALDMDVYLQDTVGSEILDDLVATLHVGYYNQPRSKYTYDTNPKSTAYIDKTEGEYYFIGAFFGGCRETIIQMALTIERNIKKDMKEHRYIAVWHDDSHLNRYLIDHPPTKLLSPEYLCTPSNRSFRKRIVQLSKGTEGTKMDAERKTQVWKTCDTDND